MQLQDRALHYSASRGKNDLHAVKLIDIVKWLANSESDNSIDSQMMFVWWTDWQR